MTQNTIHKAALISSANADPQLCRYMALLGHNKLNAEPLKAPQNTQEHFGHFELQYKWPKAQITK